MPFNGTDVNHNSPPERSINNQENYPPDEVFYSDGYDSTTTAKAIFRQSSITDIPGAVQDQPFAHRSTELDRLSTCLTSEAEQVSAISDSENPTNIIQDLFQGQLCLWSLIAMCIYSAFWQRHRKKLIASTFICTPVIITTCITISWLIGIMIIICRLFSLTMINPLHVFGLGRPQSSSRGTPYGSHRGSIDSVNGGILPQPNCQMHASNASLNSLGMRTARKRSLAQAEGSFDL